MGLRSKALQTQGFFDSWRLTVQGQGMLQKGHQG